ncbi:DUF418 domain-containing protein [Paenibacillus caseinilyticus]|uniref:DUF418 domain-containing protein n=1 Tax=Paenibacillus mucilaginosus TaxID=61624 RepID=UPI00030E6B26|nr:DUF418 domain-containing protein [Paenibacillus mucilaginosus]
MTAQSTNQDSHARCNLIDGLRGFSLLGILTANMLIFQYGVWGKDHIELYGISAADRITLELLHLLVEGSFMPIFTFLFGFGLAVMKDRLEDNGLPYRRVLMRRFLLLLGLGFLHACFLWEGDILIFYGMMGFFLLLFIGRKARTLLIWSVVLIGLLGLVGLVSDPSPVTSGDLGLDPEKLQSYVLETMRVYGSGTYGEIMHYRNNEDPMDSMGVEMVLIILLFTPFLTAPLFLLGMYAARRGWFRDPEERRTFFRKGAVLVLPAGLLLKGLKYVLPGTVWSEAGSALGMYLLPLGYIFAFTLLYTTARKSSWLYRFEAVGRLSLTNYLLQTVICTSLFYGYGLGWFGKLGVPAGIGLALGIYLVQLYASTLYLNIWRTGPVERLLRMGTYFSLSGRPAGPPPGSAGTTATGQAG